MTARHAGHSGSTVRTDEASLIRLEPRGEIRGSWIDGSGMPVANRTVTLDRTRETTTDGTGFFAFEAEHHHG